MRGVEAKSWLNAKKKKVSVSANGTAWPCSFFPPSVPSLLSLFFFSPLGGSQSGLLCARAILQEKMRRIAVCVAVFLCDSA